VMMSTFIPFSIHGLIALLIGAVLEI